MGALEGKVALVLGATRGIGKGIALELGEAGALTYVTGRTLEGAGEHRPGSAQQTVREIEAAGGRAVALQCDASDDAALAAAMQRIGDEHGALHVLVNTVFDSGRFSSSIGKKFWELPVAAWDEIVDVGTRTAYVACVEAAPLLLAAGRDGGALVVNVSSLGAVKYFYNVAYGAGKAALDKMTADMAIDLDGTNVAVVSLWPNVTRTEGVEASIAAGNAKAYDMFGGVDRLETPRYAGRGVVALATDANVMAKSGKYFWTAQLGEEYGFVDENGRPHGYPGRKKTSENEHSMIPEIPVASVSFDRAPVAGVPPAPSMAAPESTAGRAGTRPLASRRDDVVAGLCALWMVTGLFLDGWAHINNKPETFFTPWHAVFYSGFLAAALWLLFVVHSHQRDGRSFRAAIPIGYGVRVVGVAVFGAGAVLDFAWHEAFGIEQDIEALLSPSHLTLLTGGVLLALGPIASSFAREGRPWAAWRSSGPIVATVAFLLATIQFFLMYLSPYETGTFTRREFTLAGRVGGEWLQEQVQIGGVAAILAFTLTTTAALLWLVRHVGVPRGALAVVIVVPAFLQTVLANLETTTRMIGPIAAGLLAEATWPAIRRRAGIPAIPALWIGGLVLTTWYGLFAGVAVDGGVAWQVEFWSGVPALAALLAGLLTLATWPAAIGSPAVHRPVSASSSRRPRTGSVR